MSGLKKAGLAGFGVLLGLLFILAWRRESSRPVSKTDFFFDTFVTITLYNGKNREKILDECMDLCRQYENTLSKTRSASEIYQINHRPPGTKSMAVSPFTAEVLGKGLYYSELSHGAFDLTIEPLSSLWDFKQDPPRIPAAAQIEQAAAKVDYRKLYLWQNELFFQSDESRVDLGGIAKGYMADRIKAYLKQQGVTSAVINLGGNVLCVGAKPDGTPFLVGLQKPFGKASETASVLAVKDMSVVSSGIYERYFEQDGIHYHHLLNPKSGYPYDHSLAAVTILSPQSVDGDGLSTVCFSLGLAEGMELIEDMPGIYAFFFTRDGQIHASRGAAGFIK